ncbi:truncated hemoglobin [Actomonas aquatica]|uniref:Group III truncated hemoglobin n=1 Tax=Actomonas aquatica TaxID=2866162 RepID=A0ABZ1C431_9BACT|nr:group III truncated hemoglobin [Opitutus sp. WL0086]WRQ86350.1 group III truncated hemoglobin [Opitutus sp. WL0086]
MTTTDSLFDRVGGRDPLLQLLRSFYADVRQHADIGPIFAAHVTDWPNHLEKIANFWSTVLGGPTRYAGPVYHVHKSMPLQPPHFAAWLELWSRHCHIKFPGPIAEELVTVAHNFARRLQS